MWFKSMIITVALYVEKNVAYKRGVWESLGGIYQV